MLKDVKAVLLDVQGTLTTRDERGNNVLIGGVKFIETAKKNNLKILVLTNATKLNESIVQELRSVGLPIEVDEVLSAGQATGLYISEKFGRSKLWVLGEKSLEEELKKYGHQFVDSLEDVPDFVVVGLDRDLNMEKLNRALRYLRKGAKLIGCHASKRIPEKGGETISVGPIVKALEYASDTQATIIGKPSPIMYQMAVRKMGISASEAVMVSDELSNDLYPARELGMKTVLVLTGVTKLSDVEKYSIKPDMVVDNIDDLVRYFG